MGVSITAGYVLERLGVVMALIIGSAGAV